MTPFRFLLLSMLALRAACIQFEISAVENVVGAILATHDKYVHFDGNYSSSARAKRQSSSYWYENISHQGISAFGPSGYQVFRNVKDYGARGWSQRTSMEMCRYANIKVCQGDGVTDDTAAINLAISASVNNGVRCGQGCASTTTTPAVVYFPAGTYLISSSIMDYYYTQLIGDATNPPTLKATAGFAGFGLIDGDHYYTQNLNWGSTNVFYRQVRNFVFDLTNIPPGSAASGIHWPTAQATSLQNIVFQMSAAPGTQHVGVFCESGMFYFLLIPSPIVVSQDNVWNYTDDVTISSVANHICLGSAGFMTDLTFNGGNIGAQFGNQQFTMRNLVFNNCVTAIQQLWDWGWLYQGISINNCQKGIDISAIDSTTGDLNVGSVTIIDSSITNTPIGIITAYQAGSQPPTAGSLILENVALSNVPTAVQLVSGATVLAGTTGTMTIAGWGEGNQYTPTGPQRLQGSFTPNTRPGSLLSGSNYYVRSKPQYQSLPVTSFQSVRSAGATGNGVTDDTTALQNAINSATSAGNVVFFDAGTYLVTSTLLIPPGAKLVGESYSVIMSSGSYFNDINNPKPVVQVGTAGATGQVEWSDMIVSTQGTQAGAILIEWNLATSGTPSGMWDVHARVGGFVGSNQQVAQCVKTPTSTAVNTNCIAAYMTMHVTPSASGLYMENVGHILCTIFCQVDILTRTGVALDCGPRY
jgi:glucan 1,3-beta-glucosidase